MQSISEVVEQAELLYAAGGSVKWSRHFGKLSGSTY